VFFCGPKDVSSETTFIFLEELGKKIKNKMKMFCFSENAVCSGRIQNCSRAEFLAKEDNNYVKTPSS
jgi:hypothetical protein